MIRTASIFCSSSNKIDKKYFTEAYNAGQILAQMGIVCYTGAGNSGLMNEIQEGVLQNGGKCIGVIPQFMIDNKWLHTGLSEVVPVQTMAERKNILRDVADTIIVLAGGVGTFDELFETLALKQLGLFSKPVIIINTDQYFEPILNMLEKTIKENFMHEKNRNMWQIINSPNQLKEAIQNPVKWNDEKIKFDFIENR